MRDSLRSPQLHISMYSSVLLTPTTKLSHVTFCFPYSFLRFNRALMMMMMMMMMMMILCSVFTLSASALSLFLFLSRLPFPSFPFISSPLTYSFLPHNVLPSSPPSLFFISPTSFPPSLLNLACEFAMILLA